MSAVGAPPTGRKPSYIDWSVRRPRRGTVACITDVDERGGRACGRRPAASADTFLSTWVPRILASPAYKADGLLIVAFSATNPLPEGAPAPAGDPLRVGALLPSPLLTPGATDPAAYTPYSLLRPTEDLFGLEPLAHAVDAKTKSFASSLLTATAGD